MRLLLLGKGAVSCAGSSVRSLLSRTNLESDGAGATDVRRAVAMSEKQRCAEMLSLARAIRAVAASEADASSSVIHAIQEGAGS